MNFKIILKYYSNLEEMRKNIEEKKMKKKYYKFYFIKLFIN